MLDSVYTLSYMSSNTAVNGCNREVTGSATPLAGNVCGMSTVIVSPGAQRLIRFSLFRKSDLMLLEAVNFCIDRTLEPLPEGFVYNPSTEEF